MMTLGASTKDVGVSGARVEFLSSSCAVYAAPASVVQFFFPAPAAYAAPAPVGEYIPPAPGGDDTPALVSEYITTSTYFWSTSRLRQWRFAALARVDEYTAPARHTPLLYGGLRYFCARG